MQLSEKPRPIITNPALCEPFQTGRQTGRLLYDCGAMISLLNREMLSHTVLDFGAGSGWITEIVAKMGLMVTAFDIHADLDNCVQGRASADARIDADLITTATGDGHAMPFDASAFGHILCYDTLHHMHDYGRVFAEFFRLLRPGGRAIFVEPGANHSRSPETIEFMKSKQHDPGWIERDVVLEEIEQHAIVSGFHGLNIVPLQHPEEFKAFSVNQWRRYRRGSWTQRNLFSRHMAKINYDQRVVFYCEKPY
jgi:SAM-dependent methyltransferase